MDIEHDTLEVVCHIMYRSQKAVFIRTWCYDFEWIPESTIYNYDELDFTDSENEQVILVAKWFVKTKNLSYY